MNKNRENEVYINPVMRKPRALRSMLPLLLSRPVRGKAAAGDIHAFRQDRTSRKMS